MRAVVVERWGAPESAAIRELAEPVAAAGEVLIATVAAGVNYADLLVVQGRYQNRPPVPFTPGKELAGTVVALGAGVADPKIGDRVMAQVEHGAYAERVVAPARQCRVLPEAMSFETGAALGLVYQTAFFALTDRAAIRPGDKVLVTGASGGVGLAAIELARAFGAATVIAAIGRADKAVLVRRAGADAVVDLAAPDLHESLRAQVRAATGGDGVDIVVETVGGAVFDAALRALAWRGRLVVVGFASGQIPSVRANYLLVKNIAVSGLQWSDYRERTPELVRDADDRLFAFWRAGRIRPHIFASLRLDDFAEALAMLAERRAEGKIVLTMGAGQSGFRPNGISCDEAGLRPAPGTGRGA